MDVGDWEREAKLVGDTGGTGEATEDVIYKHQYQTEKPYRKYCSTSCKYIYNYFNETHMVALLETQCCLGSWSVSHCQRQSVVQCMFLDHWLWFPHEQNSQQSCGAHLACPQQTYQRNCHYQMAGHPCSR